MLASGLLGCGNSFSAGPDAVVVLVAAAITIVIRTIVATSFIVIGAMIMIVINASIGSVWLSKLEVCRHLRRMRLDEVIWKWHLEATR